MALIPGRRAGGSSVSRIALSLSLLLAGGLCVAVALLPTPLLGPVAGATLAAAVIGGVATGLTLRRASRLARQVERLSGEIDLLSRRLLTVEQREAPAMPAANLENGLSEITAEIGLLGGIVRELAMAVAAQDEDLTQLKAGPVAADQPVAPAPVLPVQVAPVQVPPVQAPPVQAPPMQAPPVQVQAAPVQAAAFRHPAAPGLTAPDFAAAPLQPAPLQPARAAPPPDYAAALSAALAPVQPPSAIHPAAPSWMVEPAAARPAPSVAPSPAPSAPSADAILQREAAPAPRRPFVPEPAAEARPEAEILDALSQGLEVHLQPVVSLPQRKVAFYEALARLRVGDALLSPAEFVRVLERHGRTTELDRLMLARVTAIGQHLASRGSETPVAYALSPGSLFEPGFLRAVARLIDLHPELAGRLILALPQRSWRNLDAEQASALNALRERIGLAVDRVADPHLDTPALAARGVSYAKVGLDTLLGEHGAALAVSLARAGIRLVAEGVEREADVPDLIDLDLPLAQGAVFSPPRVVRPEVLSPPAPEPAPTPSADDPPPPVRRAFRDVLRRAV